jgi:hypothetical protein
MTRVQHIVGRSLGVAWPSSTPLEPRPSRSSGMGSAEMIRAWLGQFPEAHARLEGTDLATWFGPPGDPVLELPLSTVPRGAVRR